MYSNVLQMINIIFFILLGVSVVLMCVKIFAHIYSLMPAVKLKEAKENHKYAILVPARNESHVINNLLSSLDSQKYPKDKFDIYVIVEREDDPTIQICKQYSNCMHFIRPNLNVKTKGAALDQMLKYLLESGKMEEKGYEAVFVFDADNVAADNFLYEMNKTFDAGYELAMCYRNSSNWNGGWVASCSALTFSMINTFNNKFRSRFTERVLVCGTGFFLSTRIIKELGGYPFHCLTEDVELSNWAALNNIKGAYNENTEIFDEQPSSWNVQWNQRVRWIKGHMQVTKKYQKALLKKSITEHDNKFGKLEFAYNILPVAFVVVSLILYCLSMLTMGFIGLFSHQATSIWVMPFIYFGASIFGLYFFLMLYTAAMLLVERKHSNITVGNATRTVFVNPFFMSLWLPIAIFAFFKKEISWKVIEHKGSIDQSEEVEETN